MSTIEAKEIATNWLSAFATAIESGDVDAVVSTILPDGWLRDVLIFTWGIRCLHGTIDIKEYLCDTMIKSQVTDIKLDESLYLAPTFVPLFGGPAVCVEVAFTFETSHGHGQGYVRLLDDGNGHWKAFTLFTNLSDLRGYEEATGPEPILDQQEPWLSWQEVYERKKKKVERDPHVLISESLSAIVSVARSL